MISQGGFDFASNEGAFAPFVCIYEGVCGKGAKENRSIFTVEISLVLIEVLKIKRLRTYHKRLIIIFFISRKAANEH